MQTETDTPLGEAIPPEDEPDDELENEDDPDAERADAETIAQLEEAQAAELERARRAYWEAVAFHFGDDAPLFPCPTCETKGYLFVELAADPSVERCGTCRGLGVTGTGSLVPGNEQRSCPTCQGSGFRPTAGAVAEAPPVGQLPPVAPLPASAFPYEPIELQPVEQVASGGAV